MCAVQKKELCKNCVYDACVCVSANVSINKYSIKFLQRRKVPIIAAKRVVTFTRVSHTIFLCAPNRILACHLLKMISVFGF